MLKSPRLAAHTQDDGFHEIQLNGKQLVFLFMAATVVSVVIFLCGVLVGRGVRVERIAEDAAQSPASVDPLPAAAPSARASTPTGADPTVAPPPPTAGELSYPERLEKGAAAEELKPSEPKAAALHPDKPEKSTAKVAVPATPRRTSAAAAPEPGSAALPPAASASPGSGYAVQIAALNVRSEAEAIAKKLNSKGYAAYVQAPTSGTPAVYRARVGTLNTRREADWIAAKLQKEEQFKPWVTR